MPLVDIVLVRGEVTFVFYILDRRVVDVGVELRCPEIRRGGLRIASRAVLGEFRRFAELLHAAIFRGCAFDGDFVADGHAVVLLEYEDRTRGVLYEEALRVGADHLSFDLVNFVDGSRQHLGYRRKRCLLFLTELDCLPAVARGQQYVVDTVHAAHLGFELDVERAGACRQGEVCCCEAPLTRFVRYAAEIVVERLRPKLPVGRKAYHKVRLDERVGGALCVALRAEREAKVLRRYRDLLDREIVGRRAEEDVVFT